MRILLLPLMAMLFLQGIEEEIEVGLVNVYLTATDSRGRFLNDLRKEELQLKENGVLQEITHFTNYSKEKSDVPLTVALLIDNSVSMNEGTEEGRKLDFAAQTGLLLLKELKPQDQMILFLFNDKSREVAQTISGVKELEEALRSIKIQYRRTALFDAIYFAMDHVKTLWGRKVFIICSDGQDNASKRTLDNLLVQSLNASDVTVVSLGTVQFRRKVKWLGDEQEVKQGKKALEKLAQSTGGPVFFPKRMSDLDDVVGKLRGLVGNQYSLAYRSSLPPNENWREIELVCKRRGVKLQYRRGYSPTGIVKAEED